MARSAPTRSDRSVSSCLASRAPRPARNTGRRALASASARPSITSGAGHSRGHTRTGSIGIVGQRLGLDVERQAEQHRAALHQRGAVGAAQVVADGGRGGHPVRDHADRGGEPGLVDVEVGGRLGGLGGEHEQRGAGLGRLGEAGQRVGQARALVHAEHADLAGDPGVGVGHHGGAALVAGGDEPRAVPGQRVGDVEVAAADDAEHRAHPGVPGEGGTDPLGDGRLGHGGPLPVSLPAIDGVTVLGPSARRQPGLRH